MKKIETLEQRQKALAWMVEVATHPLEPVLNDPKTKKLYDYMDKQVQEFNAKHFAHLEYPEEEPQVESKGGWFD